MGTPIRAIAGAIGSGKTHPWMKVVVSGLGGLVLALVAIPVSAAERLIVGYGVLERSIAIQDLEYFAETGQLTPQLTAYNRQLDLNQDRLAQIREWLTTPADLDQVAVAQFLYTEQGKLLLKQLTQVIQTPSRRAGFSALRSALILAAADGDGEGLTLLNVLQHYPTAAIRVDLAQGLTIAQSLNQAFVEAELAIELVQTRSQQEAEASPLVDGDGLIQLIQSERQ